MTATIASSASGATSMVGEICQKLNLSLNVGRAAAELLSELGGEVVEGVEDDVLAAAAVYACALAADEFRSLAEVSRAAGVTNIARVDWCYKTRLAERAVEVVRGMMVERGVV